MNDPNAIIVKFLNALPAFRDWIQTTHENHNDRSVPLTQRGYNKLPEYFPNEVIDGVRVVTVPQLPIPPFTSLGLSELSEFEQEAPFYYGITYQDTVFLREDKGSESLFFHELIHVVQWTTLGIDKFLLAYGTGLMQFGYRNSPIEKMAYELEEAFNQGTVPSDLVATVQSRTQAIWNQVAPLFEENP